MLIESVLKAASIVTLSLAVGVAGNDINSQYHVYSLNKQFNDFNVRIQKQINQRKLARYLVSPKYKEVLLYDAYNRLKIYTGQTVLPLVYSDSDEVNAWTDGEKLTVTKGILAATDNEDEIANIVAHEMSHEMLKHVQYGQAGTSQLSITDSEAHADKMGTYLMMRAGFDICKGKEIWKKFQKMGNGDFADTNETVHPSYAYRYYAEQMPFCK